MLSRWHGELEGVASDDLVYMGSICSAGEDKRIGTLNDELRARESQHVELPSHEVGRENRKGGNVEANHGR